MSLTANISSAKQFRRCEFFFSATHRMVPLANCVYHVSVVLEESWFFGAYLYKAGRNSAKYRILERSKLVK